MTNKTDQLRHILAMIEENPTDAGVLDEIDCRVDAALEGDDFIKCMSSNIAGKMYLTYRDDENKVSRSGMCRYKYTRSLDAQEALKTEGWTMASVRSYKKDELVCEIYHNGCKGLVQSPPLINEHLARLHARIQVIIWEIENG